MGTLHVIQQYFVAEQHTKRACSDSILEIVKLVASILEIVKLVASTKQNR